MKRHFYGVSLADPWWPSHSGNWILSSTKKQNKPRYCQSWALSNKTFWMRACLSLQTVRSLSSEDADDTAVFAGLSDT